MLFAYETFKNKSVSIAVLSTPALNISGIDDIKPE